MPQETRPRSQHPRYSQPPPHPLPSQWLCPGRVSRCSVANNKPVTAALRSHDGGQEGVDLGTPKAAGGGGKDWGHQPSLCASPSLLCLPTSRRAPFSFQLLSPPRPSFPFRHSPQATEPDLAHQLFSPCTPQTGPFSKCPEDCTVGAGLEP